MTHLSGQSEIPRRLLITGTVPGSAGVGEIILRDLCESEPRGKLCCVAATKRGVQIGPGERHGIEIAAVSQRRFETAYRRVPGIAGEVLSTALHRSLFRSRIHSFVNQAIREGKRHRAQLVWAVLDCPTTIYAARQIAARLQLPLAVLVWDAPELLADQLHYDRFSRAALLREFAQVLRVADRRAVVGETMQARYEATFGARSVIVRHGLAEHRWRSAAPREDDAGEFRIGYAGSITAPDAFQGLIWALDAANWRIGERDVVLRIAGARYLLSPTGPQRIEYHGWRSVDETVQMLADCDVSYLPQPFTESARALAELSFPTKLSTYLAAGRPILWHGPEYGSIAPFFRRYPFGTWCGSPAPEGVLESLRQMNEDRARLVDACQHVERARRDELNEQVFLRRFREFLQMGSEPGDSDADSPQIGEADSGRQLPAVTHV